VTGSNGDGEASYDCREDREVLALVLHRVTAGRTGDVLALVIHRVTAGRTGEVLALVIHRVTAGRTGEVLALEMHLVTARRKGRMLSVADTVSDKMYYCTSDSLTSLIKLEV
jgi:hypothetical protein